MNDDLDAERKFDQECIDVLVRLGMGEIDAAFFLGRFLTAKTGQSWTLIQIGEEDEPKFFVPTAALRDPSEPLKN